jgi:glycosyltransferase 2 family protein
MSAGRFIRLVVGLGLTAVALWLADPVAVWHAAAAADPAWIAAAVALVVFDRALMAYRWIVLVRAIAGPVPLPAVLRVFFVSTFVGTFLPSVGGDAVRAVSLARYGVPVADATASVVMDRLLGVWSLVLVACASLWGAQAAARDAGVLLTLALAATACAAAGVALYSDRAAVLLTRLIEQFPGARLRQAAGRFLEAMRRYRHAWRAMASVTLGSVIVQMLRIVQAFCLGMALGIVANPGVYFAVIPIVLLIMLVPVTVNGLGTSQLAFVWLFGAVGVPEAQAFALSVLFVALGAIGNLPGGLIYAFGDGPAIARTGS